MRELLRTTDIVQLSFLTDLLRDNGIYPFVLDSHMSVLEGSANAIPRRLMVSATDHHKAKTIIEDSGEYFFEYDGALTKDFISDGTITLWQPKLGYRVGIDSVLLAASATISPKTHVLDLGCGVGAIALCLLNREPNISVLGLENNPNLVALANQNALENNMSDRFKIINGSALQLPKNISVGGFDLVISNPPYMTAGTSLPSPNPEKKSAHVEDEADLKCWIETAARALKSKGVLTMIHRADRLSDLLINLDGLFGEIIVHPLWPKVGLSAKRVILKARKDSSAPLRLQAGTIIHELDGTYTPLIDAALRGRALHSG